jgi:hypothetical protein
MAIISKLNDILCGSISKVDDVLKVNVSKWDDNTFCAAPTPTPTSVTPTPTPTNTVTPTPTPSPTPPYCVLGFIDTNTYYEYIDCCYPYAQITGNTGGDKLSVCYISYSATTNVIISSPQVICDTSGLTSCCEIQLGYNDIFIDPCGAPQSTYYISAPCIVTSCRLNVAFAVYTDDSCTTPAPDGYYSDGISYGLQSGGVFTFTGPC